MKLCCTFVSGILFVFFMGLSSSLSGAEISVHNNKTVTVTGKTLFANCSDTTIAEGSSIIFNSALFQDMGNRRGKGSLVLNSSALKKCYNSFYVIPRADGKSTIITM